MKKIKYCMYALMLVSTIVLFSHTASFAMYLAGSNTELLAIGASPMAWFIVQIFTKLLFILVGYLTIKLVEQYENIGFFEAQSLVYFNYIALACIGMAVLQASSFATDIYLGLQVQVIPESQLFQDPTMLEESVLAFRSSIFMMAAIHFVTKLFIGENPQTMYFMMALVVFTIKHFVKKALLIQADNQSII